jgi:DNA-directed RNA polymerase specialized sigma24 family protein
MPNLLSGVIAESPAPIFVHVDGYHQYTDAELIQRCIKRDEQAWAALLNRYGSFVYSVATRFNLMPDDVAYVFQSVFLAALENLDELAHEPKLSSWLTTVTLWRCRQFAESDHVDDESSDLPGEASDLYQEIQYLEQQRLVQHALASMDDPSRQLLYDLLNELDANAVNDPRSVGDMADVN